MWAALTGAAAVAALAWMVQSAPLAKAPVPLAAVQGVPAQGPAVPSPAPAPAPATSAAEVARPLVAELPADKPEAPEHVPRIRVSQKATHHAAGPRARCGDRRFIALLVCMKQQCLQPALQDHPECRRMREMEQAQSQP
jgi:non-specific serine/threonine protein kinase